MADSIPDETPALPRGKPAFDQDPHRVREVTERKLEAAIGREVRGFRRQQGLTVAELAQITGLSIGMLSKIENGVTSPSLTTLQVLSHAFSVPVTAFFKSYEERREVQHVKAGEHIEIERRGTRAGHQYNLLGHIGSNSSGVSPGKFSSRFERSPLGSMTSAGMLSMAASSSRPASRSPRM